MRDLRKDYVAAEIAAAIKQINYKVNPDITAAIKKAALDEASPLGRQALDILQENAEKAAAGIFPLCQDTGLIVVFAEVGEELHITGGLLYDAVQDGVRQATEQSRLRRSVTVHPITRGNSGDNTPAIVHQEIVKGDKLKLSIMAKGGGCENASRMAMLPPSASRHGVGDFVVSAIRETGAASCPPLIVGVGVGGNFETAPLLAKKALLRPIGQPSSDPELAKMEEVFLKHINELGIGPQGWGGSTTALSVAIEAAPCHIASLPVAVNVECHSHRLVEVEL
jgi:fumarate hydratase subunit alpha